MRILLVILFSVMIGSMANGEENAVYTKVDDLIPELGAGSWEARENAQKKIFLLFAEDSVQAADAVARNLIVAKDPEIKLRLEKILNRMAPEHVRRGERGFLGVSLGKLKGPVKVGGEVYHPVDIVGVLGGTAAQSAGMVNQERILSIGDFKCKADTTVEDVVKYISSKGPGAELRFVTLAPDGKVKARSVVLGDRPERPDDPPREEIQAYMMAEWRQAKLRKAARLLQQDDRY